MSDGAADDRHIPVMRDRCAALLAEACRTAAEAGSTPVVIDATVGMGGHAHAILEKVPEAVVIGVDRDPDALELSSSRLRPFGSRFRPVRAVYDQMDIIHGALEVGETVAGILFDLGVSSLQLDEAERGFAYSYEAPLDMRMDNSATSSDQTARQLLAEISETELRAILSEYGEERFSARIARRIIAAREQAELTTTAQLAAIIDAAVPAAAKRSGGHPAKRSFQALRIAVNEELTVLRRALPAAMDVLAPGGRVLVLSYHSLEDRITKRALAARTKSSAPEGLPVELQEHKPTFRLVVRGAERPIDAEIAANPRAASAKLRAAEKIGPTARSTA